MTNRRDIVPSGWTTNARTGRNVIAVIGIDRYRSWRSLSNAVNDALGARRLFQSLGFEEVVPPLIDEAATNYAINSLVIDELKNLDQRDSLVLFYAGHGGNEDHHLEDRTIKSGYLIPVDAKLSDRKATWIELEGWLRKVSRLPPRHILVILDACYSGIALDSAIDRYREASSEAVSLPSLSMRRSRRIITSALADERALDSGPVPGNSLFTGYLIEGLETGLIREGRTEATGSRIGEYVQRRVREYTGSCQTPDFGPFELDRRGEMVIPLSRESRQARRKVLQVDAIPGEVLANLGRPERWARASAVAALSELLTDRRPRVARVAHERLQGLVEDESSSVSALAQAVLNGSIKGARQVHGVAIRPPGEPAPALPGAGHAVPAPVEQSQPSLDAFLNRDTEKVIPVVPAPMTGTSIEGANVTRERVPGSVEEGRLRELSVLAKAPGLAAIGRSRSIVRWTSMLASLFVLGGWIGTYLSRIVGEGGEAQGRLRRTRLITEIGRNQKRYRGQTPGPASAVDSEAAPSDASATTMGAADAAVTVVSEPVVKLAPKRVLLHVVSTPSGAQVRVNGQLHSSVTPMEIELPARVIERKRVTLSVRKRGYSKSEQVISLDKLVERTDAFVRNVTVVLTKSREPPGLNDSHVSQPAPAISEAVLDEVNPYSVSNSKNPTTGTAPRAEAEGQAPPKHCRPGSREGKCPARKAGKALAPDERGHRRRFRAYHRSARGAGRGLRLARPGRTAR